MFSHAIFTPGWDGWLARFDEEDAKLKPDSWKGYTIGDNTNKHLSKHPFRLDDEKLMYPFYEKLVKSSKANPDRPGLKNVCIHKGLFPPSVEAQFPHLVGYCTVADVGKAAKDWPQLNFVIYHSAYRWVAGPGGTASAAWDQLQRTGRVDWVTDLAEIPQVYGVNNVYADLGQIFAHSNMAEPRVAAFMLGYMIKGMGADHVVWGTDSLWTGAPQWQIEALRRMEIPEEIQKKYGFAPMGAGRRPGEDGDPRRQQRPALRLHAEDAGRAGDRQGRLLQGPLREARRRAHQPRLRLHQQRVAPQPQRGPRRTRGLFYERSQRVPRRRPCFHAFAFKYKCEGRKQTRRHRALDGKKTPAGDVKLFMWRKRLADAPRGPPGLRPRLVGAVAAGVRPADPRRAAIVGHGLVRAPGLRHLVLRLRGLRPLGQVAAGQRRHLLRRGRSRRRLRIHYEDNTSKSCCSTALPPARCARACSRSAIPSAIKRIVLDALV